MLYITCRDKETVHSLYNKSCYASHRGLVLMLALGRGTKRWIVMTKSIICVVKVRGQIEVLEMRNVFENPSMLSHASFQRLVLLLLRMLEDSSNWQYQALESMCPFTTRLNCSTRSILKCPNVIDRRFRGT